MPQLISTTVYLYDELPTDKAKGKAREWFLTDYPEQDWADFLLERWKCETLPALGFDNAEIQYSGFWSQGDGASFTCSVDFLKYCDAFGASLRPMVRRLIEKGSVQMWAKIARISHRYSHENTVCGDWEVDNNTDSHPLLYDYVGNVCANIIYDARATMRKLYRELEKEYDYQTSEEQVVDAIRANEYTFTETGKRFG